MPLNTHIFIIWNTKITYLCSITKYPKKTNTRTAFVGIWFQRSQLLPAERKQASVKLKNKTETDRIRYKFQLIVVLLSVLSVLSSTLLAVRISIELVLLYQSLSLVKCCKRSMLQRCHHKKFGPRFLRRVPEKVSGSVGGREGNGGTPWQFGHVVRQLSTEANRVSTNQKAFGVTIWSGHQEILEKEECSR